MAIFKTIILGAPNLFFLLSSLAARPQGVRPLNDTKVSVILGAPNEVSRPLEETKQPLNVVL